MREDNQTSTVASVHSESTAANSLPLLPRASHSRTLSTESVSHLADEHIQTSSVEQEQVDGPGLSSPQEMIHLGMLFLFLFCFVCLFFPQNFVFF